MSCYQIATYRIEPSTAPQQGEAVCPLHLVVAAGDFSVHFPGIRLHLWRIDPKGRCER